MHVISLDPRVRPSLFYGRLPDVAPYANEFGFSRDHHGDQRILWYSHGGGVCLERKNAVGVLHWINWDTAWELLLTIVIFDFIAQYCLHWCLHKVPFLWRLHMVHHSDTHVDVTTGTRHHPVDFVVRELFAVAAMVITGAPKATKSKPCSLAAMPQKYDERKSPRIP